MNPGSDKIPNTHDCTVTKEELEDIKDVLFHFLNCVLALQSTDPFQTKPQSRKHKEKFATKEPSGRVLGTYAKTKTKTKTG